MSVLDRNLRPLPYSYYNGAVTLIGFSNPIYAINKIIGAGDSIFNVLRAYTNANEYLVTLIVYPFDVRSCFNASRNTTTVTIGGQLPVDVGSTQFDSSAYILKGYIGIYKIGTDLTFTRKYNDARDFEPYTRIKLFLPYYGYVDLDTSEVYNMTLEIFYDIDFYSGGLHVTLWDKTSNKIYKQYDGKIGYSIPLSQTNSSERARATLNTAVSGIASALALGIGVASGGVGGATALASGVGLLGSSLTNLSNASTKHSSVTGYGENGIGLMSPSYAYIVYERVKTPKDFDMDKYAHLHGKPLMNTRTLSTLKGYTRVGANDLKGFALATDEEKSMLKEKLTSGIIL